MPDVLMLRRQTEGFRCNSRGKFSLNVRVAVRHAVARAESQESREGIPVLPMRHAEVATAKKMLPAFTDLADEVLAFLTYLAPEKRTHTYQTIGMRRRAEERTWRQKNSPVKTRQEKPPISDTAPVRIDLWENHFWGLDPD